MTSFGNAAISHSGLIVLKTVYRKRGGELLWAIGSSNFINLHSAAFSCYSFCTLFGPCLQISHYSKNRWINFFYTLAINVPCKFQEHWKQGRLLNNNRGPAFINEVKFSSFLGWCIISHSLRSVRSLSRRDDFSLGPDLT